MLLYLNRPSRCARYALLHAYANCLHLETRPADASAAWRPPPHLAVEPRPHPGAPAGTAADPAGRAVAPPYAAAAALSNAPGIEAAGRLGPELLARHLRLCRNARRRRSLQPAYEPAHEPLLAQLPAFVAFISVSIAAGMTPAWRGWSGPAPPSQTTPPHGAMQRGRRRRGKSGGPPRPREQIRQPDGPVSAGNGPARFAPGALNLSDSVQTKPCLGHCITRGIGLRRQATIFRLRGAVLFSGAGAGIRTHARG